MDEYIVVGSGPAGVAAAKALLANGRQVRMLDAGMGLPEKQQGMVSAYLGQHPEDWAPCRSADALQKRKFDSAYMYDTPGLELSVSNARASASFARGGLSTVWGAAMLPYETEDMRDWPEIELAPHYRRVLSFVPMTGASDALLSRFPLYTEPEELLIGPQTRSVLDHCKKNRDCLVDAGFEFGRSRLAVRALPDRKQNGCVYCGLCMTGCPYGLVYSAEQTLRELQRDSNFSYQPGVIVSHFREKRGVAEIVATQYGEKTRYSAEKVLVAMGVWSSTRAMLQSLGRTEASIKDSQYIIIPCLVAKRGSKGRQHALSQLFIEYCDAELGNVHLQFYPFSDLVEQGVAEKLGLFYRAFGIFLRPLVQRLVVVQAFLHSDVSGSLLASLTDSGLSVEGKACKNRKRLPRMLQRHAAKLGLFPLLPLVEYCLPGQGFHSGGSFPMSDRPQDGESDLLGRCGFENIHLVDSSILPGIAGTTITLTEMANAHRIADTLSRGPSQPESEAGKQKPS